VLFRSGHVGGFHHPHAFVELADGKFGVSEYFLRCDYQRGQQAKQGRQ
jgi:hypothetical protein